VFHKEALRALPSPKRTNSVRLDEELTMSFTDKVKNKTEEMTGKAKQGIGDATNDERLIAEGQAQETSAHAKQAGEHVKDAGRDARDALS
jgi:uncharacterized protein YjbJ (UPF0337 family)